MRPPVANRIKCLRAMWCLVALIASALVVPPLANSQSPAPSGSSASSSASAAGQNDSQNKPVAPDKPKHVITNEDLESKKSPATGPSDRILTNDNSPLLNCEASCEQEAREQLGYGPEREPEWRLQIVPARRDLVADTEWRGLLAQSIQQLNTYCDFVAQASQQVSPSGEDWNSRVQRTKHDRYFEQMDKTLRQNLAATFSRMESRIQDVSVLSPVRGALMYAQANRITSRPCEEPKAR